MKRQSTYQLLMRKAQISLFTGIVLFLLSSTTYAQLGVYTFSGQGNCPTQNPSVSSQPANATFSDFTNVNADCSGDDDVFSYKKWNSGNTIDLSEYNQFTVTPAATYSLNLTSLTFRQYADDDPNSGTTSWILRSSLDNYGSDIATGDVNTVSKISTATLSSVNFTGIGAVTFRLYILNIKGNGTRWIMDDVTLNGTVTGISAVVLPADPAIPTSNSPQCSSTGVTMHFNGTAPAGETWYWETSPSDISTANATATYTVTTPGTYTYYVRSQNNTTLDWSNGAGAINITVKGDVAAPVFTLGSSSTRCQGGGAVTYTATAANSTSITYSLDLLSAVLNTINSTTGQVTYSGLWNGSTTITATAAGCNGPVTSTHVVSVGGSLGTPAFSLGNTSTICQGAQTILYSATAGNAITIIYSLDAASLAGNNTIDPATGNVTYDAAWSGTTTITATASGCGGPKTKTHVVTVKPAVGIPAFGLGATSTRCQSSGSVTYTATASNNTGITYSLDAASMSGGNSINTGTGKVTYVSGWVGTSLVTATATGCGGPVTSVHTVTITAPATSPVFDLGASSIRCQGAGPVTYNATSANATSITYSLNGGSIAAGNTINATTGQVNYVAGWSGTSVITANASGCSGIVTGTHSVTTTANVATPVFNLTATSSRCQGAGTVTYTASASNNTGITYDLDAASLAGGNTINSATGAVLYASGWSGTSIITATATGCAGPTSAVHTATIKPSVVPAVFTSGTTSTRCQGTGTIYYAATAANSTSLAFSQNSASITGGNLLNTVSGAVTYAATWTGNVIITATAAGCNGPVTATHTITTTATIAAPVFTLGTTSTRCQDSTVENYAATATNSSGITYSLDAVSLAGGNTIDSITGDVSYVVDWSGTSKITAKASGCNGPKTSVHTVTTKTSVGIPVFAMGDESTRCQGVSTITYTATAANSTGIVYDLDQASIDAGNTIDAVTGIVDYDADWTGTSVITAAANGCNGPSSATHTVTITPTVGTPSFGLGASSNRCQGAATIVYTATATEATAITYSLNAASISAGNTINSTTGSVHFVAGWTGSSTITATAVGCNGPKTGTHLVAVTPVVGTPVFNLGYESSRAQGAGTSTYTATATNATGVTYTLDAASITGGNSINASSGTVTWSAAWMGTSMVTATVAGCSSTSSSSHIIVTNPAITQTPLYLSIPGTALDRIDPVATNITATTQSATLSATGTTNITFTQNPVLCSDLTIKAQTISVIVYVTVASGTMPANPSVSALIKYGTNTIINLTNPIYNASTGALTWTGVLGADVIVPTGQAIALQLTTAQAGVTFKVDYHSITKPSRISLLPVSTYVNFTSFNVYSAPYPGGSIISSTNSNVTVYGRAVVTSPFGYKDITGLSMSIISPVYTGTTTCVDSSTCSRTYQFAWTTPAVTGAFSFLATVKQGFENLVTQTNTIPFFVCTVCPPVARPDSATGSSGTPLIVDVLANDYDPNNNMNKATLSISAQPNNGTGYVSAGKVVYLPNGSFNGKDTLTYQICDSTGLCANAKVYFVISSSLIDPCTEATKTHIYYLPFSENEARIALDSSTNSAFPSNNIRTVISMKMPYPGMKIVWDQWEDGYEANALRPTQSTTKVWGDGNPYNGIAPGYPNDIIPAGGSIVLDNIVPTNPRVASVFRYDGKDKITASGQITVTQVCGEPSIMAVQCMKTNVSPTTDYGTLFTIPAGKDFPSQDFRYTSLFIRAAKNNTTINIDKDNNGTLETTAVLQEGQVYHVNGGVLSGATVTATAPIGVELHFGGNDSYSSRDIPIFPASWYYSTYYSPVPTVARAGQSIMDTSVVMLYNNLNRPITINWTSGIPSSGSITLPAKKVVRFPLSVSATAAYKFVNPTGESFTAIQICDSYTPGGGGNAGQEFDWAFNLIAENRLTDFATVAWAPGSIDGTRDDNPLWVTPTANTTIYVKNNGDISGTTGLVSPCGMRYDVSYPLNTLSHKRLRDLTDNDQSGMAVFTCDGTKLAAVYGEDPSTAVTGSPSWDVGSTIQPFCKQKLIFANDDYVNALISQPVTIPVLTNDFGFLATIDPTSVSTTALLQPSHGTVTVNANGTILYTPVTGYVGNDTFEYSVCSTPTPVVCDIATVYISISACPTPLNANIISGQVFFDKNKDGLNNDGGAGVAGNKAYLYVDVNCNSIAETTELKDSVITDASGSFQFTAYPEKTIADDFDGPGNTNSCGTGSDGNTAWATNWVDAGDGSVGYCQSVSTADAEITKDPGFSYALRLKDKNISATRTANLNGASYAFLTFSYRRKMASMVAGRNIIVQASPDGSTFSTVYTILGDGTTDANYVTVYNQDITAYASATTYIRFLTSNTLGNADTVYIDDVKIQYLKYPICYITKLDAASIPSAYHTTTVTQKTFNVANNTSCQTPGDFGLAKNTMTISGNLYNDANGLVDNLVNGTLLGTVATLGMNVYLADTANKVIQRTVVNPLTGGFSFTGVDVQSTLKLGLSTLAVNLGVLPPIDVTLPANWVATGDAYGLNNLVGTGNKPGGASASVGILTGTSNITGVNFGIERLPNSDDKFVSYTANMPGVQYAVPGLTGSDPEDFILGNGKSYKITTLPTNAILYYNGIIVTANTVVPAFNSTLFKIDPNNGVVTSTFTYAAIDAAGMADPTPATVQVNWITILPITLLDFDGKLNGTKVDLFWRTSAEINGDHFDVERSTDGQLFKAFAQVKAKGNTSTETGYAAVDPTPVKGLNYYRLKMVDKDAASEYSKVVTIKVSTDATLTTRVMPNPFTGKLDIYLTLPHSCMVTFNFVDVSGKVVYTKKVQGLKGFNWFVVNDLQKLPTAPYILNVITDEQTFTEKLIKE